MHLETCRSCGGELDRQGNYYVCRFCGNKWMIDAAEDVHVVDRANAWAALRDCDFEKAAELFENIIFKDKNNHEAHWGRALALAGIIYVTDFHESRRVPTCNNISESSFIESRDVKAAIALAPVDIADSYKAQAERIDAIRSEWVKKARKEPPYDVFICFKDSDRDRGLERTDDSYEAQNLYHALKEEGYKVFFSRESLRGKVSEHYEPYIYNALKTAKVMIVYGQNPEYFSAVWVKNEWLRFRNMIESGEKPENSLVVAYKGIDPADLPTGLRSRQCMNANEFTFFDDLKAHIRSVIKATERAPEPEKPKAADPYADRPEAKVEPVKKQEIPVSAIPEEHFMNPKAKKIAIVAAILALAIIFGIAAPNLFVNEKTPDVPVEIQTHPVATEAITTAAPETVITEPHPPLESVEEPTAAPEEPESPAFDVTEGGIRFWLNDDNQSYKVVSAVGIENLVIPDSCNSLPVTEIMESAFSGNTTLVSVTIPESVVIINKRAFYGCESLCYVTVGGQVSEIGDEAFMNCGQLADLIIPEDSRLINVGISAFQNCSAIKSVMLPDGVESIGEAAFNECKSLESIFLGNKITEIAPHVFQGCEALTEISIPESVNKIGDYAFERCIALSGEVKLSGVTEIGVYAFDCCEALAAVTFGGGLKSIGQSAFAICSALTEIALPEGLENIDGSAFSNCDGLKTVVIPSSVTHIGAGAFDYCDSLESVEIKTGLSAIPSYFCSSCTSLKSLIIPETVTAIYQNAFDGCPLENVTFGGDWDQWDAIDMTTGNDPVKQAKITCLAEDGDYTDKLRFEENENGGYTVYNNGAKGNIVIPDTYNGKPVTAIGENGFMCFSVTSSGVRIPTYINSITIPASVVTIGKYAFGGCADLETLTFKEGSKLQSIGPEAFKGCSSLVTLTLPDSVESIGYDAFYGCDSMNYNVYDNASYLGNEENPYMVLVKATSTNISSCEIHSDTVIVMCYAFENCEEITEIVVPAGVKKIQNYAFYGCVKINKITIPYADYYFKNWFGSTEYSALKEIVITGGESIGGSAFKDCKNIKTVTIPASVKTIGQYAFENCTSLETVKLSEGLITIENSAFKGCTNLWNIAFPTSLESIGQEAFRKCASLGSLTFGSEGESHLKSIGWQTFGECTGLTSVTLPDSLEINGDNAFWGCTNIETMTLPFTGDALVGGNDNAFYHIFGGNGGDVPASLKTVTVTGGTTVFFANCKHIESISLPEGVQNIENKAFAYCTSLESIIIPSSVTSIKFGAFEGCSSLASVSFGEDSKLESIGDSAFVDCVQLTEIILPSSIESVADNAFKNCSSLEGKKYDNAIYLGNESDPYILLLRGVDSSITSCEIPASTRFIYTDAFKSYSKLESVVFSEGSKLQSIGSYAFRMTALKSVVIPKGVTYIGFEAFGANYYSLKEVTFEMTEGWWVSASSTATGGALISSDSLLVGSTAAFLLTSSYASKYWFRDVSKDEEQIKYGEGLEFAANGDGATCSVSGIGDCKDSDIVIPSTSPEGLRVTKIGDFAFDGCVGLKSITIPEGVTSIGANAFDSCGGLTSIEIPDSVTSIGTCVFRGCEGLKSITIPDGVTSIGDYAFDGCGGLESIIIPDGVTSIGCYVFRDCSSLTNITIPDSVTSILEYAFYGCEGLKSITIPDDVTNISSYAFYGCVGLTSITIPDSLKNIGHSTFSNCSNLKSINIPDSVTSIGGSVFSGCEKLATIYYTGTEEDWAAIEGIAYTAIPEDCEIIYNYVPTNE